MYSQVLFAVLPYAVLTAFTPGPSNVLALNAVSHDGWRRSAPLLFGIAAGLLGVMVVCALTCFELARVLPVITGVLKYIGVAYLVWLAIHIARSKPGGESQSKTSSFWTGFFLQFANVKVILFALTVYSGYVLPVSQSLLVLLSAALLSAVVGISGTMTWACMGGVLQKLINRYYRIFNLAMAAFLLWSAVMLLV